MEGRACELCGSPARLHCISDSAFLCFHCDAHVHQANFLVARHARELLCPRCRAFSGCSFSGVGFRPDSPLCRSCSCSSESPDSPCESSGCDSSLTCASTSGSFTDRCKGQHLHQQSRRTARSGSAVSAIGSGRSRRVRPVDARAEGILESWCRRLGWSAWRRLSSVALRALGAWRSQKSTALPLRVCLAASLWFASNACGPRGVTRAELKKLEGCSGVPASVIVAAESRLRKVTMIRVKKLYKDEEEGWAEC